MYYPLIQSILNVYPDDTIIKIASDKKQIKLILTDKYAEDTSRYFDYYILLSILYVNNEFDKLDNIESVLSEDDLIYWYGSDEEADKRAYQLEHFKEVYKC